jgi:hypothetical protein
MDELRVRKYTMTDADEAFVDWLLDNIGEEADAARALAMEYGIDAPRSESDIQYYIDTLDSSV